MHVIVQEKEKEKLRKRYDHPKHAIMRMWLCAFVVMLQVTTRWQRAAGSGVGRTTLEGWGISRSDALEIEEALYQTASSYAEGDSDMELWSRSSPLPCFFSCKMFNMAHLIISEGQN